MFKLTLGPFCTYSNWDKRPKEWNNVIPEDQPIGFIPMDISKFIYDKE